MAKQTVAWLHSLLADLVDGGHGERELLITHQQNYPINLLIDGIYMPEDSEDDYDPDGPPKEGPIYIVAGSSPYKHPYGTRDAWENVRTDV